MRHFGNADAVVVSGLVPQGAGLYVISGVVEKAFKRQSCARRIRSPGGNGHGEISGRRGQQGIPGGAVERIRRSDTAAVDRHDRKRGGPRPLYLAVRVIGQVLRGLGAGRVIDVNAGAVFQRAGVYIEAQAGAVESHAAEGGDGHPAREIYRRGASGERAEGDAGENQGGTRARSADVHAVAAAGDSIGRKQELAVIARREADTETLRASGYHTGGKRKVAAGVIQYQAVPGRLRARDNAAAHDRADGVGHKSRCVAAHVGIHYGISGNAGQVQAITAGAGAGHGAAQHRVEISP